MNLSYFHFATDVPTGKDPAAAVVIDVLRATTTIAWALQNGAEAVQTFAELEELRNAALKWPKQSRLLLGERGGKKLEGFDLGNSPVAVTTELVKGKRLFMSTTNGTRSLERVKNVNCLFTLSMPNRKAVANKLLAEKPKEVWIVGSGWEGSYSLEDSMAAGSLAKLLLEKSSDHVKIVNDELNAAIALWELWKDDIEGCLRTASHGKRLERFGNHDADFLCCSQIDEIDCVPSQIEPGVLSAS